MSCADLELNKQWQTDSGLLNIFFFLKFGPEGSLPVIEAKAVWRQNPENALYLEMASDQDFVQFNHSFGADQPMVGYFRRVSFSGHSGDNMALWGDFHYNELGYGHFEGVMITYLAENVEPNPTGPCDPNSWEPEPNCPTGEWRGMGKSYSDDILYLGTSNPCDLFPYIYMSAWPDPGKYQQEVHFIKYTNSLELANLFSTLTQQRSGHNQRSKMIQTAVDFVDGTSPWDGQWIDEDHPLKTAISKFHCCYHQILVRSCAIEDQFAEIKKNLETEIGTLKSILDGVEYRKELDRVWQNFFALVILQGYRCDLLVKWAETLITAHVLDLMMKLEPEWHDVKGMTIVLPQASFPLPPIEAQPISPPVPEPGVVAPYAMGDLQMVSTYPRCYQPGDIASVLNLMPGESQEITSRILASDEIHSDDDHGHTQTFDNQSQDGRDNLLKETLKTLADNILQTKYDGFDVQYGPPTTATLQGGWTMESKPNNASPSKEAMASFARKILNTTVDRLERRTRKLRRLSATNTRETSVVSRISNPSDQVVHGIYRWLDKVYHIQVSRYGRRMLVQFLANHCQYPESGSMVETSPGHASWTQTQSPGELGINSFKDINQSNYAALAAHYGVTEVEPPPASMKTASLVLQEEGERVLAVPCGYQAESASVMGIFPPDTPNPKATGLVGGNVFTLSESAVPQVLPLQGEQDTVAAALLSIAFPHEPPVVSYAVVATVTLTCTVLSSTMDTWKIEIFKAILVGYQASLRQQSQVNGEGGANQISPTISQQRSLHLKNQCCKILMEQVTLKTGQDFETLPTLLAPPRYPTFFEQIFEWDHLSSASLPFTSETWMGGSETNSNQMRVMVPVVPGEELRFLYFLDTGMIWCSSPSMVPIHLNRLQVAERVRQSRSEHGSCREHCVSWEIVIPTTMKYLQNGSELHLQTKAEHDLQTEPVGEGH